MSNITTNFAKIIIEILKEENIDYTLYSDAWVFGLNKAGKENYIFGYQFGLNSSVTVQICNDKCTCSEILSNHNIPNIEHICFMTPLDMRYANPDGNWKDILKLMDKYQTLVCKNNEGTGGDEVYLIQNQLELENASHTLLSRHSSMSVSPYIEIKNEYRLILLNGKVKLAYCKVRPFLTGDGKRTIKELYCDYLSNNHSALQCIIPYKLLDAILTKGEIYYLNWKHNLGQGAESEIITDTKLLNNLSPIALKAAYALNINFASIDIVDTDEGLKILEINAGVMMEYLSGENKEHYKVAKEIYREAILSMF